MRIFIDTNVAVYAHDQDAGDKREIAARLLSERWEEAMVSTQVLVEFRSVVARRLSPPLDPTLADEATRALAKLPVVATDRRLVLDALDTAAESQLSLWDALIVEAAVRGGCDELYTEDLNAGQVIRGVTVVNPFA